MRDPADDFDASSRRSFLISATSAGFTMAFAVSSASGAGAADASAADAAFAPTIWYEIDREGVVTVNIIRAEMGQHVGTALARIVADELEADWASVRLRYVDTDPRWGTMVTGGSWSIWQSFPYLSQAGAAGRLALIEEGAKLLRSRPDRCTARDGVVRSGAQSISYAEIVRRGQLARRYSADELKALPIKPPAERRLIGRPTAAIDIPAKTTGAARYGIDASVPGMAYARPKLPPTRNGCTVQSVDDSAARGVPGYIRSLVLDDPSGTVPGWVVVCAESFVAASRAADLVKVTWVNSPAATVSEADIQARGWALIKDPAGGSMVVNDAGVDAAFSAAKTTLERDYTTATALHFQLEPLNALAFQQDGRWEIHTGNQWQSLILPTLAKALAVPAGTGLGIATTFGQERDMPTWCACVARVRVDRRSGVVKVERLTVVVDAGTVVHPDGALAQVEGAALWGLSLALFEGTEFVNGQVRDTNLNTYTPLRMRDVPPLDIEFMPSTAAPTGLGEPATTVVGPAIGNAIFAAVGVRLRHLPMRPANVLSALAQPPAA